MLKSFINKSDKMQTSKSKMAELHTLIYKLPMEMCCVSVLPELGIQWRELSRVIRNARLPMTSLSIARVLCQHIARNMPEEEIIYLVSRLKLKSVVTKSRTWHVVRLSEKISDEPVNLLIRELPSRVLEAFKTKCKPGMMPEVQSMKSGNLLYISVQMLSRANGAVGSTLYIATPPGEPLALVSAHNSPLMKAAVFGLGYEQFEAIGLSGRDIKSLLEIANENQNRQPDYLTEMPSFNLLPCAVSCGIDYISSGYIENLARTALGASPPRLERLTITSEKDSYDKDKIDKKMKVTVQLKTEDVSETLVSWAVKGAILPTSHLFQIMHDIKSNKICFYDESQQ